MDATVKKRFKQQANRLKNGIVESYFKIENNKLFSSIRQGFVALIPIFMVGAIALAIMNFPVEAVRTFIQTTWRGNLYRLLRYIYEGTFGLASIFILFSISYNYSRKLVGEESNLPLMCVIASVGAYLALLGVNSTGIEQGAAVSFINFNFVLNLGTGSVFSALLCAILATRLFLSLCKLTKRLNIYRYRIGTDVNYYNSIIAIIPLFLTVGIFALASVLLILIFRMNNINEIIIYVFSAPFKYLGTGYGSGLLILLMQTLLWFFGIHGGNVFDEVTKALFPEVGGEILTKTFFDNFVLMGGCGASICLLIAILIFSKSKTSRSVAKNSAFPMVFNINEILVYGLPIVFNPVYLVPFIFAPMVTYTVSYLGMRWGMAPIPGEVAVGWTTPLLWSGYAATGSVLGALLQLLSIAAGVGVYAPFVRWNDKLNAMRNDRAIDALIGKVRAAEAAGEEPRLFSDTDYTAAVARELAMELRNGIKNNVPEMYYQPQIDANGRAVSCEALLRWKYNGTKFMYPPLVIAIAKEDGSYDLLNEYIVDRVIDDTVKINERFGEDFHVSVNLQAVHFNDIRFIRRLIEKVKEKNLIPGTLSVEITEQTELIKNQYTDEIFRLLGENHIAVEIDDFSMGHTSLNYLQEHDFSYVKLDGGLVKHVTTNPRIRDIVHSITSLGQNLGFKIIAEFVETEEQKDALKELGCYIYQGWLYSPAIAFESLLHYVASMNRIAENKEFNEAAPGTKAAERLKRLRNRGKTE